MADGKVHPDKKQECSATLPAAHAQLGVLDSPKSPAKVLRERTTPLVPYIFKERSATLLSQVSKVIQTSNWYARAELYATAFLSMFDMVSDLVMAFRYASYGKNSYAIATFVCAGISLSVQSIMTLIANLKFPWQHQLREQVLVWSLFKPAVDAYRVATHVEQEAGSLVSSRAEMTSMKVRWCESQSDELRKRKAFLAH